ncbi:hypothetical protein [Longispora albida]|uniref:hypothetical protein n=1 Tax=Longispora albida TaxID=203523 RepID=UPI00035C868A|nr:hypothetical protein [Longispora albida]
MPTNDLIRLWKDPDSAERPGHPAGAIVLLDVPSPARRTQALSGKPFTSHWSDGEGTSCGLMTCRLEADTTDEELWPW